MLALIAILASCLAGDPFSELEYDAALAQATKAQKLLLIDFTASWCGPCRKMEKDTWPNADVRSWLAESAIAIQIDIDENQELAKQFEIQAIPAIVALRDGKELDRVVGYRDAPALLAWAKDARAGKSSKDALLAKARELQDSTDVSARYDLAQELQRAGLRDEALHHYLWLWPATREASAMAGVRVSFMLSNMARLAGEHEPAKRAFLALLEETQARVDESGRLGALPDRREWSEWTRFCQYFQQQQRVVVWYEAHRDEAGRLAADAQGTQPDERMIGDVYEVLLASARPVDAVRLLADASKRAERLVERYRQSEEDLAQLPAESREDFAEYQKMSLIAELSQLYGALLASDRRAEAAGVAQTLLATLDGPESRMGLVGAGLELAPLPEPSFSAWLDQAAAAGADVQALREQLAAKAAARTPSGG